MYRYLREERSALNKLYKKFSNKGGTFLSLIFPKHILTLNLLFLCHRYLREERAFLIFFNLKTNSYLIFQFYFTGI